MKNYIGTKLVMAWPMTRADYNDFRKWQLPADESGADEGYFVCAEGGKPNHPDFDGYVSWLPREQFDGAYIEIVSAADKPAHLQRMYGEAAQLDDKRQKLLAFINGEKFAVLCNAAEQARMIAQYQAMTAYSEVLWMRILQS